MIDISEPDKFNWNFTPPKKEDIVVVVEATDDEDSEETDKNKKRKALKEMKNRESKKKCRMSYCKCWQKFCCFKDTNKLYKMGDRYPSCIKVCCWRYLKS